MDRDRIAAALRIILAAGIVMAVVLLAGDAVGWGGTASAQTVPTAPPPSSTPAPPEPTAPTKTSIPAVAPTATSTAAPTEAAAPATAVPATETEAEAAAPVASETSPTPVPAAAPVTVPPGYIGGIALAILLLAIVAWLLARRRGKAQGG